ncbi:MAG TPA: hypothetical protein DHW02_06225 [Ktedonobacter sp.]|nr:hypothetical protein [Ktedonobacter sp.]
MVLRRTTPRFVLLVISLFLLVACSSVLPVTTKTVTHTTSVQVKASAPTTLQMLQQRPLHLPVLAPGAACPTSPEKRIDPRLGIVQGNGPAYATIGTETITSPAIFHYADAQHFANGVDTQGWGGQKVLWFINPSYHGLVLVRGHQLDGTHEIGFDNASSPQIMHQLVIDTSVGGSPWPNSSGYTRIQAPGCYAYQVDGTNFSYVIVFEAVVQN